MNLDLKVIREEREQNTNPIGSEETDNTSNAYQEVDKELENLKNLKDITDESLPLITESIEHIFAIFSTLDFIKASFIENNNLCDYLMHFLFPVKSLEVTCKLHDIFNLICTSSERAAKLVYDSSYFISELNYFFDAQGIETDLFPRVIHSLAFGLAYFHDSIGNLFFAKPYQERIKQIVDSCPNDKINKEIIRFLEIIISLHQEKSVIFFATQILMNFYSNPEQFKRCTDAFIEIAKRSSEFVNASKVNGLLTSVVQSMPLETISIKARVKNFVLLRHLLSYDSALTVQIITKEFCDSLIVFLDQDPIIQEYFINSLHQISLNDNIIPEIVCQSDIFQRIIDLSDNSAYKVMISCRLLFASFLRTENSEFAIFLYGTVFESLDVLFDSDEPLWIIESLDAIMAFLELMQKANPEIVQKVMETQWIQESLENCKMSSVERIANISSYILSNFSSEKE